MTSAQLVDGFKTSPYANNDPLNKTDPTGMRVCDISLQVRKARGHDSGYGRGVISVGGGNAGRINAALDRLNGCLDQLGQSNSILDCATRGLEFQVVDGSVDCGVWESTACSGVRECAGDMAAFGFNVVPGAMQSLVYEIRYDGDCYVDTGNYQWTCTVSHTPSMFGDPAPCKTLNGVVACEAPRPPSIDVLEHEHNHAVHQGFSLQWGWLLAGAVDVGVHDTDDRCDLWTEQWADLEKGNYQCE